MHQDGEGESLVSVPRQYLILIISLLLSGTSSGCRPGECQQKYIVIPTFASMCVHAYKDI